MDLLSGQFVATIREAIEILTKRMASTRRPQRERLVVFVFAHPSQPLSARMVDLLPYWNFRSSDYIDFFFLGYVGTEVADDDEFTSMLPEDPFSNESFVKSIEYLEANSTWKFSGEVSALVCRAKLQERRSDGAKRANLDFDAVLDWRIDEAIREKVISSVESLFEEIIRASKEMRTPDEFSNDYGLLRFGETLWEMLLSNIPIKASAQAFRAASFWSVKSKRVPR